MLAKLRVLEPNQDVKKSRGDDQININFHEEYLRALRTKSYADCFNKAQLLATQSSKNYDHNTFLEFILEPDQETIPSLVESATISMTLELRNLMLSYFDISAEASHICTNLLKSINQIYHNHEFILRALDSNNNNKDNGESSQNFELVVFELNSFMFSSNPFSNLKNHELKLINDKYSSVLRHLRSMRRKVGRKHRIMKYLKKLFGICLTATCGIVAIMAMVIASHAPLTSSLFMGIAILNTQLKHLKKKLRRCSGISSESDSLSKVYDQLDVAAKGTYIMNRDFDTMSRLVERIHDEIEHNRTMVQFCLDRKEEKCCLQIVKELGKSDVGFRKQVEELEEHVYLCLVTINKARALVIKEMKK
ncbi:hypothetical protein PIB30_020491 [Stylosanthes scabra]|uniref:Uncharacterized protein n=1 Tax=Stylosanthes scabra TaxID=79078 RepID=A0ABU6W8N9_9FABA|nr:hypothetical protein [Stylosanthes scabra]